MIFAGSRHCSGLGLKRIGIVGHTPYRGKAKSQRKPLPRPLRHASSRPYRGHVVGEQAAGRALNGGADAFLMSLDPDEAEKALPK